MMFRLFQHLYVAPNAKIKANLKNPDEQFVNTMENGEIGVDPRRKLDFLLFL